MNTEKKQIEGVIEIETEGSSANQVLRKWKEPKTNGQKREAARYERYMRAALRNDIVIDKPNGLDGERKLVKTRRHRHRSLKHRANRSLSKESNSTKILLNIAALPGIKERMQELGLSKMSEYLWLLVINERSKAEEHTLGKSSIFPF
jgi:hypothetical protein